MQTFLDQVANEVLKTGGNDFSSTCIVLPNRRAGVFFKEALSRASKGAIWAPKVLSIEDFVFSLSGQVKVDRTNLLFIFYEVYQKQITDPQSLELFANWAPKFLSDVNEVDLNLIDAQDIYAQLYSVERIARWNPENSEPTDFQKKHLKFVKQLHPFYLALRSALEEKKYAYQGMAFRHVAENVEKVINTAEWDKVLFAGFNGLTVAEEQILDAWAESGKGEILWDMDSFYADDPIHEAGQYIRKYLKGNGILKIKDDFKWKSNRLSEEKKNVHLIAVQRNIAQAQAAASILRENLQGSEDGVLSNTAVVLNDEKLLMPLLHALPTALKGVNITMGYGLQNSQSAAFIEKLFRLYMHFSDKGQQFYHEDVSRILEDSLYLAIDKEGTTFLRKTIVKEKRIYLDVEFLANTDFNKQIFAENMNTVSGFLTGLQNTIGLIHARLEEEQELQVEMEFLFLFEKLAQRLKDLTEEFKSIETLKTLHAFWKQLIRGEQLDFVGEPLKGLQIMGMLETRNLDFENVIILGVNEGQLPSSSHAQSYFTFDVRRVFGLACQNERDAVTGYHFYRLLQRTKSAYLVYDQDTDSFGRGEVSRYVRQLKMEHHENIKFSEWNVSQEIPSRPFATELYIEKGDSELQKVKELSVRGFSPSALNTFRSCSLKYYFKYVAGCKEQQELNEEVDHAIFGSAVHGVLEDLYKPYLNKPLSEEILKSFKANSRAELTKWFGKELALDGAMEGRNLLAFEVGLAYLKRVLDHDIKTIKQGNIITPLFFEEELKGELELVSEGKPHKIRFKGLADRIDRLSDGTIRLIDYKTGSFSKLKKVKSADEFSTTKADHAFQLLMYTFMYNHEHPEAEQLQPTVFYLRSLQVEHKIEVFEEKVKLKEKELIDYGTDRLMEVVTSLYDPKVPFAQTEELTVCQYCDFNQICQRQ